jgi:hypothetical protein
MTSGTWLILMAACMATAAFNPAPNEDQAFRPPAIPLVAHDPYFSVWSFNERLTDNWSRHWTGAVNALAGMVRIDGTVYRFAGSISSEVPPMDQCSVEVLPLRTLYTFQTNEIELNVTFLSPLLPKQPELLSRPLTYLIMEARSKDGKPHDVKLYVDCTAEWAVDTTRQPVRWSRAKFDGLHVLSFSSEEQPVLEKSGDNLRIDWGSFYLALGDAPWTSCVITGHETARVAFAAGGVLPASDDIRQPRPARDDWPVLACTIDLGTVKEEPSEACVYLAYDDLYSVEYFKRPLRPFWRKGGKEFGDILAAAVHDQKSITAQCRAFDDALMSDLRAVGGEKYARIAALAYRQVMAAHKIVADFDGTMLMFSKENFSNGCMGTVDVLFPSSPFFLLLDPGLLEAQLRPIMDYAASPRWPFPFAPHDLGTYPLANGQVYGSGERSEENQMPVEESGNMLILLAALTKVQGHAGFAENWWPVVSGWAGYLRNHGLDPKNQLCTDDFTGHLAHNVNLSVKAILGLGSYAMLCKAAGKEKEAADYRRTAEGFVKEWMKKADNGDHYRLAFDRPGTWSMKYNLFWDKALRLELFPDDVARRELAFYRTKLNPFGLPLDNRENYTKLDFHAWVAALAESREDFEAFMNPLYDFAHATPDRVPLTDWFRTTNARHVNMQARSVVGGLYGPLLVNRKVRRKWAERSR